MNTVSRNLLILFLIVVWVLYTIFVYQGCYDTLCPPCGAEEEAVIIIPPDADNPFDLSFSWDVDTPMVKQSFVAIRDSLISQNTETKILTITGKYFKGEKSPVGFDNLGLARADQIKKRLFGDLPESQVRLRSSMLSFEPEGARTGYFEAANFGHIQPIESNGLHFIIEGGGSAVGRYIVYIISLQVGLL